MRETSRPATSTPRSIRTVLGAALVALAVPAGALAAPGSVHAALPGADGLIAYVSNRDGNLDIWTMTATGEAQTNVSQSLAADKDPAWSPDGSRIAFASTRDGAHLDIWTMNADGSGLALLTPGPETTGLGQSGSEPSWSPDGARIAYVSGGDLWVMNADGTGKANLTSAVSDVGTMPAWSPDGARIAYVRDADVWVMNADGSGKTPLTATTGASSVEKYPDWSPDGTRLTYERTGQIWRMRADGTQQKAVTSGFAECGTRPAWSSVGTRIVFASQCFGAPNGPDIYTAAPDGTRVQPVGTTLPSQDLDPAWQPVPTAVQQPTYLTLRASANDRRVSTLGELFVAHPGQSVTLTLSRLVDGSYEEVASKQAELDAYGSYRTTFPLPDATSCRVVARFLGDADHRSSTRTRTFDC